MEGLVKEEVNNCENGLIKTFNNQVAGHKHPVLKPGSHSTTSLGIVKFGEDCILKPIVKPRQGHTEISFYQQVWSSTDGILSTLQQYIPKYHGITKLKLDEKDVSFLRLQDLSAGMKKPCIADIKIGAITWEPNVDLEKQFYEASKYADTKDAYGLSLTGYQVFNLDSGQLLRRDKDYGKSIKRDQVQPALKEFFNYSWNGSQMILRNVLKRLYEISSWWHQQTVVNIFGSSILILYDAWELEHLNKPKQLHIQQSDSNSQLSPLVYENIQPTRSSTQQTASRLDVSTQTSDINQSSHPDLSTEFFELPWVRVYMIDFAHVIYPFSPNKDDNYIRGITSLIKLIETL